MKAMLAKRAAAAAPVKKEEAPPPANPAEAMKAMLENRVAAAAPPKLEDETPPTNPADAMKAMLARRAAGASTISTAPAPATAPSSVGVPLNKDPKFAKYFKMMKMGVPLPAAKVQMIKDGLDGDILDQNHKQPYKEKPPLKEMEEYKKYFKMLKMMIPLPAVKQQMMKDGLNPNILDCEHTKPLPKVIPGDASKVFTKVKKKRAKKTWDPKAPKLKEDENFVKYFKMIKMGLPVGAVQNAMKKDGKDPKILELDPEKSLSQHEAEKDSDDEGEAVEVVVAPKRRRKKLDWKPIEKHKVDKGSIWGDMSSYNLDLDMEEFDTLFVAQVCACKSRSDELKNCFLSDSANGADTSLRSVPLAKFEIISKAVNTTSHPTRSARSLATRSALCRRRPTRKRRRPPTKIRRRRRRRQYRLLAGRGA